eukprot:gb/GECG01009572.1/.p1 GENE.gb/GECG01009572.1/~~gb/GECG01009572.1/.p1  ORF type:complete len:663 (+),score=39.37 gb/GECG01009572.1/:1-1989(+)
MSEFQATSEPRTLEMSNQQYGVASATGSVNSTAEMEMQTVPLWQRGRPTASTGQSGPMPYTSSAPLENAYQAGPWGQGTFQGQSYPRPYASGSINSSGAMQTVPLRQSGRPIPNTGKFGATPSTSSAPLGYAYQPGPWGKGANQGQYYPQGANQGQYYPRPDAPGWRAAGWASEFDYQLWPPPGNEELNQDYQWYQTQPLYREDPNQPWVKCDTSMQRHEEYSHFLDKVTPANQRNWPKYGATKKGDYHTPTIFEECEISEEPCYAVRNTWRHTTPGNFWSIPIANEVEVTDQSVTITKLKPMGKCSGCVLHLAEVDGCSLQYRPPEAFSFLRVVAWILNSRIARLCRSQFLFMSVLTVMTIAVIFEGIGVPSLATILTTIAAIINLFLAVLSICRDCGVWRGKGLSQDGVPYPRRVRFQRQVGQTEWVYHHPYGLEMGADGTYKIPPAKEDISMEEYEAARRECGGLLTPCGSKRTLSSLFLLAVGVGASVVCIMCNKHAIENFFGKPSSNGLAPYDDYFPHDDYFPNDDYYSYDGTYDGQSSDSWKHSVKGKYGCKACIALIGAYFFGLIVAKAVAFPPLPLLRFNYIPHSSCTLNLYGPKVRQSVDLGDIENAKDAARYILQKRDEKLESIESICRLRTDDSGWNFIGDCLRRDKPKSG